MKMWPVKRGGFSQGDNLVVFYYLVLGWWQFSNIYNLLSSKSGLIKRGESGHIREWTIAYSNKVKCILSSTKSMRLTTISTISLWFKKKFDISDLKPHYVEIEGTNLKIRNVERRHLVVYRIPIKLYIHGSKDIPYIFHITPLNFKTFSWSNSLSEFLEIFTFNSRINENLFSYSYIFFELLITSIYDFNTNVNSRHHNFLWLYSKIW